MPNSLLERCSRVTSNADFALPKFLKDALFYSNAHEQRKAEIFISPDIVASYMKNEEQSCLICLKAFTEEQGIWSCKVCPCLIHGNCVERWAAVNRDFDGMLLKKKFCLNRSKSKYIDNCFYVLIF
ncbi:hypothetical protein TPS_09114 [Trichinella pseudospiralis]